MNDETYSDEINLLDYIRTILKRKRLVIGIVIVGVVGTALVSLIMTKVYESKAVIIPAGVLAKDQGAASSFLAMQFGLAPPTSPASAEILNLLKSNIIKEKVLTKHNLLPLFFSETERKKAKENEIIWRGIRRLQGMTTINFTPKDNVIELTVRYRTPEMAEAITNYYLTELNEHMSGEAKRVAQRNKTYLEAQIDGTPDPFIRAKIYALIAQQIETSTMAEVKENFAFKTVDPPRVPDQRVSPKRTLMVIVAFVISLAIGVIAALVVENIEKRKQKV